jgi:cell division protein FtsN
MVITTSRWAALAVATMMLSALAACGDTSAPPQAAAPTLPPAHEAPPPELLGGPPPPPQAQAQQPDFTPMAPIPNPDDMSPAERDKVYGANYGSRPDQVAAQSSAPHRPRVQARLSLDAGAPTLAAAPLPAAAKTPSPVAAAQTPAMPPPPAVAPARKLEAAVAGLGKTAVLAAPADLSAAKPGKVTLSLPANLFSAIRAEAVKLGLAKAARKTEVTATLSGDGYTITPNGPQTQTLKPGKAATFTWQVLPGPNAKGALKADVSALLKGAKEIESVSLAHLEQTVAAVEAVVAGHKVKTPALKDWSRLKTSLFWGGVALIGLVALWIFGRVGEDMRNAEERRRRTSAAATAGSLHEDDLTPLLAAQATNVSAAPEPVADKPTAAEAIEPEPAVEVLPKRQPAVLRLVTQEPASDEPVASEPVETDADVHDHAVVARLVDFEPAAQVETVEPAAAVEPEPAAPVAEVAEVAETPAEEHKVEAPMAEAPKAEDHKAEDQNVEHHRVPVFEPV